MADLGCRERRLAALDAVDEVTVMSGAAAVLRKSRRFECAAGT
jgi:hypothetical protein